MSISLHGKQEADRGGKENASYKGHSDSSSQRQRPLVNDNQMALYIPIFE